MVKNKMSSRILPTTERFSNFQAPGIHVGGKRANHLNILRTPIDGSLMCLGMLGPARHLRGMAARQQ